MDILALGGTMCLLKSSEESWIQCCVSFGLHGNFPVSPGFTATEALTTATL